MDHHLRELSHTADVGFEVRAPTLEDLFEGAARGLVEAIGVEPAGRDPRPRPEPVRLSRPDLERLLVHWLRELLARSMADGEVPEAEVRTVEPGDGEDASLRAGVRWRKASGEGPVREIKGVTYHGLRVAREGEDPDAGWHARVVLDV